MKETTSTNLKNIFGSLIFNKRAIECGRTLPWWSALIVFVLSVFIPVIPSLCNNALSKGESFLSEYTYNYENHLAGAFMDLSIDGYTITVDTSEATGKNIATLRQDGLIVSEESFDDHVPFATYVNSVSNEYEMQVFFTYKTGNGAETINDLITDISYTYYWNNTTGSCTQEDLDIWNNSHPMDQRTMYRPSILILSTNYIYAEIVAPGDDDYTYTYSGDWINYPSGTEIISEFLTVELEDGTLITPPTTEAEKDELLRNQEYLDGFTVSLKSMLNYGYISTKNQMTLYTTLIYEAIYITLTFFMGLLVYLLTRGKRNYYHFLKHMTCQKINAWAAFSPAVLAMALGWLAPNYGIVFYIIFIGIRIIWMSLRQLRQ
ncbi:MAG: hypothetical protein LUD22_02565 [Coprobacillus sp.]|nr:hypothetical protein [Coprobacillus sp.]